MNILDALINAAREGRDSKQIAAFLADIPDDNFREAIQVIDVVHRALHIENQKLSRQDP